VGIASIGIDDAHRWKDSVTSPPELTIWLTDGIANGLRPWVAKFAGKIYDRRWVPVVETVYNWHWKTRNTCGTTKPGAGRDGLFAADRHVLRRRTEAAPGRGA
jgi:hypothetical protein